MTEENANIEVDYGFIEGWGGSIKPINDDIEGFGGIAEETAN